MSSPNIVGAAISQGAQRLLLQKSPFWSALKPASFAGVPFYVLSGSSQFGRKQAVHDYPFRDTPWVEDIGRASRRIQLRGFLVGDDVISQRAQLISAAETKGNQTLVHPTLGSVTGVALMTAVFNEVWDQGRKFEIGLTFIVNGAQQFPTTATNGASAIQSAGAAVNAAAASTFSAAVVTSLATSLASITASGSAATMWGTQAVAVTQSSTSLLNLAVTLPGNYGRLLGQSNGVQLTTVLPSSTDTTVAQLEGTAAASRASVAAAFGVLVDAAATLDSQTVGAFSSAVQALVAAVLAAAPTPWQALVSLAALATYVPAVSVPSEAQAAQAATVSLTQLAAASALASAASQYQPSSSNDALAVRSMVTTILDAQILAAGNAGNDSVFSSLRAMRALVAQTMNALGAALPGTVTVSFGAPLPALSIAQRLYRDPTRSDELIQRANPIHPAFMPTSFQALNA